jgi:CRISPR-associated endonuclease/helicase Cas3
MPYFAHTVSGRPEAEWEKLARHLGDVAVGAKARGDRFGAGALANVAGQLHDLGKYSPEFQARLRNDAIRADHSTAGAVWAHDRLGGRWGRLIAHVVAGHHAGLQDGLLDQDGRLDQKRPALAAVERAAAADGLVLPVSVAGPALRVPQARAGFASAFLTRMLFSCLIDADRTAAAAFSNPGQAPQRPPHPSIAALEAALHGWIDRQQRQVTTLNATRDRIFRAVVGKASSSQGAFTLTVPTGGGKTLTALAFALAHAREWKLDRVIVVIPFTSVIEQTAAVYRDALGELGDAVLEHHSAFEMEGEAKWAGERTGPERLRLAMERWDHPIVVTTAVQFFESLFSNRPSRCRKLHSLAGSVVVVDEAQTMPLPLLRPCVAALRELVGNYRSSVVLCTATQPSLGASAFPGGFANAAELADDIPALFTALRRVTVRSIGEQDDAALASRMATASRALCIVNQRAHARALFQAIRHLPGARHLSTCMHSLHRRRILAEIRADLHAGRPCLVVSTSLIEAGVDVDFPLVLRATAGLDQIAQAAGRCNREGSRSAEASEVLVFDSPSYPVIRLLRMQAETGRQMLDLHAADPFGPDAMRAYFQALYDRKGEDGLDRAGILERCEQHKGDMNFPFATIADEMRFIDDAMVPVIVPKEEAEPGEVERLVDALRFAPRVGGIARQLGRYTVGVPRTARKAMVLERVAEVIRPDEFGDQFVVLLNLELYHPDTGLEWEDPTFRSAESLVVG